MMNFIFIDSLFPNISLNLRALSRGTQRYRMAFYQHEGVLALTEGETKLGNYESPINRFGSFLEMAQNTAADLVITPEYSCPWEVVKSILDDQTKWPGEGKLWALGSESITPQGLIELATHYENTQITVYFDKSRLDQQGVFFDPFVYLFRANFGEENKLVVLIQFKTHHMGVWGGGEMERNRLIEGREIYILRNSQWSVNLLTLICSEAINFRDAMSVELREEIGWSDRSFLILNPQLNPDPTHEQFINFRNFVFEQDRKEVISLNWNSYSKIGKHALLREGTSRSGIFMSSPEINFGDKHRIRRNHDLGLYYFYFGKNRHAYLLNSKAHAFLIEQLPVHINEGSPQQRMRNGPELMATYRHREDGTLIEEKTISDDHMDCLNSLGCTNNFLSDPSNCVLEKERLVCLSSGTYMGKNFKGWAGLDKLFSFNLNQSTELNNRITYTEDTSPGSNRQRQLYLTAINELDMVILPNKSSYPNSLADLKEFPVFLAYTQDVDENHVKNIEEEDFRYNLVNEKGSMVKATVCYLGLTSLRIATETFQAMQSMFDTDSMNRQRVVVFYRVGQALQVIAEKSAGSFVTTEVGSSSSFLSNPL